MQSCVVGVMERVRVGVIGERGQGTGEGEGGQVGSAVDGMKAFWGSSIVSAALLPLPVSGSIPVSVSNGTVGGVGAVVTLESPVEAVEKRIEREEREERELMERRNRGNSAVGVEEEDEGDEAEDLWDENGEVRGSGSHSKKRFRRHTIAY